MNILIITDYFPPGRIGGVGEVAAALQDSYRRLGHSAYVLTTGPVRPGERERGIWRSHPKLVPGVLLNNLWAPRLIRQLAIDLVHLQQASSTPFLLAPRRGTRPTILSTIHVLYRDEAAHVAPYRAGGRVFRPGWREHLERAALMPGHRVLQRIGIMRADGVTVMSETCRDRLGPAEAPIAVIPNATRPPAAAPPAVRDRELLAFIAGRRVLAYSGVFRTRKRLPVLLLALAELVRTHRDTILLVLGGGRGQEEAARKLIAELGLHDHVWLAGPVPQPSVLSHLRLADVFCMVSSLEGMPVALLEAMSLGLAVVGTRAPGTEDAIDDGVTGLLVEVDDVEALTAALRRLLDDAGLRQRLGEAAGRRIVDRFNWDRVAAEYLAFAARLERDERRAGSPDR